MSEIRPELYLWVAYLEKKEELEEAQDRIAELEAALDQLLDDMRDGLCVCQQAKDEARAALAGGKDE